MNETHKILVDTARVLLDSVRHADTIGVSDSLAVRSGTVTPWFGVLVGVVIGVVIGLVFIVRK